MKQNVKPSENANKVGVKHGALLATTTLFLSFSLAMFTISFLLGKDSLELIPFFCGLCSFILFWLGISLLLSLLRKTPLIIAGGFFALLSFSFILGNLYQKTGVIVNLLVMLPLIILLTILTGALGYFWQTVQEGAKINRKLGALVFVILSVGGITTFLTYLLYPGNDVNLPHPVEVAIPKKYLSLIEEGYYNYQKNSLEDSQLNNQQVTIDLSRFFAHDMGKRPYAKFNSQDIKLETSIFQPEGIGPFPLIMLVTGGEIENNLSYDYLGEFLASKGYLVTISTIFVKQNHLKGYQEELLFAKALTILEYLQMIQNQVKDPDDSLYNLIDAEQIVLLGFAEDGEAATLATIMNKTNYYPLNGAQSLAYNFQINTLITVAPTTTLDLTKLANKIDDLNYLMLFSGHDAITPQLNKSFYNKINFSSGNFTAKAIVNLYRANQVQYSSLSNKGDWPLLGGLLLNQKQVIEADKQKNITRTIITAFLEGTINHTREYLDLFQNGKWASIYPNELISTQYQDANALKIEDFEENNYLPSLAYQDAKLKIENSDDWSLAHTPFNRALKVSINEGDDVIISLVLPDNFSKKAKLSSKSAFLFSLGTLTPNTIKDVSIRIVTAQGQSELLHLSNIASIPKYLPQQTFKFVKLKQNEETFFATYSIPFYLFFSSFDATPWSGLQSISLVFPRDSQGDIFLDDIAIVTL